MQARVLHRLQPALQARGQVWPWPGLRQDGASLASSQELPFLPQRQGTRGPAAVTQGN